MQQENGLLQWFFFVILSIQRKIPIFVSQKPDTMESSESLTGEFEYELVEEKKEKHLIGKDDGAICLRMRGSLP